ncbi:MAG TPA: biotin/lipoyl-binding protein [Burkholderiales bacterium]|nr:biotin/lipoyl-binding protein [Burkholderiales bacterium]
MDDASASAHWWRIANLRPSLLAQVSIHRQELRGERWYLLSNDAAGVHHRVNDTAYQFIGRCDGRYTVQEVWNALVKLHGTAVLTQHEVIQIIVQLEQRELLQCEHSDDTDALFRVRGPRARRRRYSLNPFAFRLALGDPTSWLVRLDPLAQRLFHPAVMWVWLVLIAIAALTAGANWKALLVYGQQHLTSPRYLALAWVLFPIIKALHELGHALAVRRWGGAVHEFGMGLFLLVPAPYVDASAASGFTSRSQRVVVGAAGIMVELTLAAVALALWLSTQPGMVHDMAFATMFIGAVSTLLFNGNPLLRYDGYYVLCDVFDLPNLATRSGSYWGHLLRRFLLRTRSQAPAMAAGERKWLLAYAPLSFAYRVLLWVSLVLYAGSYWLVLGLLAAAYMVFAILLQPLMAWVRYTFILAGEGPERTRLRTALAIVAVVAGLFLFVAPVPLSTVAPAVVWLPEQAQVRPEVDGFVRSLPVRDGDMVAVGQLLAVLENPDLHADRDKIASRLQALQADRFQLLLRDPTGAQNLVKEIEHTDAELKRAEERVAQLEMRAGVAGTLSLPRYADLPGMFVRRGAPIGYVLQGAEMRVRVGVDQDRAYLVRHHTRAVEVRLADAMNTRVVARLGPDVPAATRQLPSAALGERGGGPFAVDPADTEGMRSLEPVFLYDVFLNNRPLERVGGRAWVRFDHGMEPLAFQGYRRASQLFLKQFDPAN